MQKQPSHHYSTAVQHHNVRLNNVGASFFLYTCLYITSKPPFYDSPQRTTASRRYGGEGGVLLHLESGQDT